MKREALLISQIKKVLTPDLLKPEFRASYIETNPMAGHCYAASEALYHLLGGSNSGYTPCRGKDDLGVTHWWLQNKGGEILDPTAEQYLSVGRTPPYKNGKGGGFLTKLPSKRAREIIRRVSSNNNIKSIDTAKILQKSNGR
ncbi:MAG: hypothetical protein AB7U85_06325 [Alphaproteobacteria bacterium]